MKTTSHDMFQSIRKPTAPPSSIMKNRKDKRVKKFDYKKELEHYK
jgi:hypothetical protein